MAARKNRKNKALWLAGLALVSLALSACATLQKGVTLTDFEAAQEFRADIVATAEAGQPAGQTFVARRSRLNSLQLWLQPIPPYPDTAAARVTIYPTSESGNNDEPPVYTREVLYRDLANQFPLDLHFAPVSNLPFQGYYVQITASDGPVRVFGRSEDVYPNGELWSGNDRLAADLSFRLTYEYDLRALLADSGAAAGQLFLILPLLLALWLPGRALLLLLESVRGRALPFDWGERWALSVGLSLGVLPVLMLWSTTLGLHWNQAGMWIFMMALAGASLWLAYKIKTGEAAQNEQEAEVVKPSWRKNLPGLALNLALLAVFLASLGLRLIMVRDMATPAWVDSVHHALLTRLILDQGAFPKNYAPLQDDSPATYHLGFHASLAVFTWLSNLPLQTSMLVFGQVLNALATVSVYLFTTTLFKNRLGGVLAALLSGLFSPMPAYYTSWGRYTQLAGLLILPACLALLVYLLDEAPTEQPQTRQRAAKIAAYAVTAISLGGLFLTHYRVAGFLAALMLAYLLARNLRDFRTGKAGQAARTGQTAALGNLAAAACLAILLTLPWWPTALSELILPRSGPGRSLPALFGDFSWNYLTPASGQKMLYLAGAGLLLSLLLNWPAALTITLWVGLMFLLANLGSYGMPGSGFINNTSVAISLYIPISALGGYGLARLLGLPANWIPARLIWLYAVPWIIAATWISIAAAQALLPILNPVTILSRQDDLAAMSWIEARVPADETIVINPFNWGYGLYAGNDGGYWIAPLARRKTLPPSALIGLTGDKQLIARTTETVRKITEIANDPGALHDYLINQELDYLYIGARGGQFSAKALIDSGLFKAVYHYRATWVLKVIQ